MRRHWVTTVFGLLLALGAGLTHTRMAAKNDAVADVAQLLHTLGAAGLGAAAADSRKVSNGEDTTRRDPR